MNLSLILTQHCHKVKHFKHFLVLDLLLIPWAENKVQYIANYTNYQNNVNYLLFYYFFQTHESQIYIIHTNLFPFPLLIYAFDNDKAQLTFDLPTVAGRSLDSRSCPVAAVNFLFLSAGVICGCKNKLKLCYHQLRRPTSSSMLYEL